MPAAAEGVLVDTYRRIVESRSPEYDEWLFSYCGYAGDPEGAERFLRHFRDLLAFAKLDLDGLDVVDAGCGFGFTLLASAALGARSARGVDTTAGMIHTIEAYMPLVPPELATRVEVSVGSVVALPYADDSVDVVLSIEAISHYRDVPAFIVETRRVLRPGGTLLIADGNNARNPAVRREQRAAWAAFEEGTWAESVPHAASLTPYRERRRDWISEHHPDLPAADLAAATFGHDFSQLEEACETYRRTGELPRSRFTGAEVPVNPEDGSVIERLFDPYELADELRAAGFVPRVRGYWGGARGRTWVRAADAALGALSRVTMPSAKAFRIAARKHNGDTHIGTTAHRTY